MGASSGSGKKGKAGRPPGYQKRKAEIRQRPLDVDPIAERNEAKLDETHYSIRLLGELVYTTDQHGITVEQLHKQEPFCRVSYRVLQKWASADKWFYKRQLYFEKLKRRIGDQIASTLVQARVKQLHTVDALAEKVLEQLNPENMEELLEPTSQEGMINAYVKLVQLGDKLREKVADKLLPDRFGETGEAPTSARPRLKVQVSTAEAREMAMQLIRQRREQIRAQLAQGPQAAPSQEPGVPAGDKPDGR